MGRSKEATTRARHVRPPLGRRPRAIIRTARGGSVASNGRRPRGQDRPADPSATRPRGSPTHMTVETSTWATKTGLAQMLKGGVIMDVVTPDQAKIAEDAGAVAVMALERVPGRHPQGRRRRPHVRPRDDHRDHGRGDHPGHGQGPDRPLRRGPGPRGARRRLHRRVRGPDPGRRVQPHRQARLQGPVRVRLPEPRRGPPSDQRGRRDDADQGRGRDRQHRRGRPPAARRAQRDPPPAVDARRRAVRRGQGPRRRRTSWSRASRPPASCRS